VGVAQAREALGHRGPSSDVLTATAADLQRLLNDGEVNSTDLVDIYLKQIESHNKSGLKLNAMISPTPKAILLSSAKGLDGERSSGKIQRSVARHSDHREGRYASQLRDNDRNLKFGDMTISVPILVLECIRLAGALHEWELNSKEMPLSLML
jgi:hypothetical protein